MKLHRHAKTTPAMRALIVQRIRHEQWPPAEAAAAAGVSVRTTYKWLRRHRLGGRPALEDASSRPHRQPRRTSPTVMAAIVAARHERRTAWAIATRLQLGSTFNVCPAGERWSDGAVRFAVEDWLAAGAILRHLPGRRSSEAEAAIAAFERSQGAVLEALMASSSGRELIELSFQIDVECAAQVDASERIPRLVGNAFVDISGLAV